MQQVAKLTLTYIYITMQVKNKMTSKAAVNAALKAADNTAITMMLYNVECRNIRTRTDDNTDTCEDSGMYIVSIDYTHDVRRQIERKIEEQTGINAYNVPRLDEHETTVNGNTMVRVKHRNYKEKCSDRADVSDYESAYITMSDCSFAAGNYLYYDGCVDLCLTITAETVNNITTILGYIVRDISIHDNSLTFSNCGEIAQQETTIQMGTRIMKDLDLSTKAINDIIARMHGN